MKPSHKIKPQVAGYTFGKIGLLEEALSHPSLSGRHNYQRLEFLGDRVLGIVIADWLLEVFPSENEGQLNQRFSALVRRETLAEMARTLGMIDMVLLSPGAEQEGTRDKEAIQCDVCEAVIGAIFLDGGFEAAQQFVRTHWRDMIRQDINSHKDAKTRLQEWTQSKDLPLPRYREIERSGPDHSPVFVIEVEITDVGSARAKGTAKKIAEQTAAERLLETLD